MPAAQPLIVLIDDIRAFLDRRPCLTARSSTHGVALLKTLYLSRRRIDQLWLDHDLVGDDTIWPVVRLLEDSSLVGRRWDIGVVKIHASDSRNAHLIGVCLRRAGYRTERIADLRAFGRVVRRPPEPPLPRLVLEPRAALVRAG